MTRKEFFDTMLSGMEQDIHLQEEEDALTLKLLLKEVKKQERQEKRTKDREARLGKEKSIYALDPDWSDDDYLDAGEEWELAPDYDPTKNETITNGE